MSRKPVVFWFRRDLRLSDNPGLYAAAQEGPVIPVYVHAPDEEAFPMGAAARWWLHYSLERLSEALNSLRSQLVILQGSSEAVLSDLVHKVGAKAVYWNRRYEPVVRDRDSMVTSILEGAGIDVEIRNGSLLMEPWELATKQGGPYRVFTPFWRTLLAQFQTVDLFPVPDLIQFQEWPECLRIDDLNLLSGLPLEERLAEVWCPGETGAEKRLRLASESIATYQDSRNIPGEDATSHLSPHLAFGEVGPRQLWQAVQVMNVEIVDTEPWLRQLAWREFAYHTLYNYPFTIAEPQRPAFKRFPWRNNSDELKRWQQGQTGYPLVDAGMRQLWQTGWMHNRVRMVVASFLVKHLLMSWRQGANWFWDRLVDADLANNIFGWQWTSGCGADAAPYFRVFNPVRQGEKFDVSGVYVRRWVPELRGVPDSHIHRPWELPASLSGAQIGRSDGYPKPMIDHAFARKRALDTFAHLKK